MRFCIIAFSILFIALNSYGQDQMDVIYTKDGLVHKGHILERNFQQNRYTIALQSGSMLNIARHDIKQIKQEPTLVPISLDEPYRSYPSVNRDTPKPSKISGALYLGSSIHTLTTKTSIYTQDSTYTGISMAGQINLNRFFALYTEFNLGSFSKLVITDDLGGRISQSGNELADERYFSKQFGVILSSNLNTGWQVFTGAGGFSEHYSTSDASFDAYGGTVQLGIGYSWHSFQITSRIQYLYSPDYADAVQESSTGHIQLGFNF